MTRVRLKLTRAVLKLMRVVLRRVRCVSAILITSAKKSRRVSVSAA